MALSDGFPDLTSADPAAFYWKWRRPDGTRWRSSISARGFIRLVQQTLRDELPAVFDSPLPEGGNLSGTMTSQSIPVDGAWGERTALGLAAHAALSASRGVVGQDTAAFLLGDARNRRISITSITYAAWLVTPAQVPISAVEVDVAVVPPRWGTPPDEDGRSTNVVTSGPAMDPVPSRNVAPPPPVGSSGSRTRGAGFLILGAAAVAALTLGKGR